jgi:uncharacterized OB-fold protein
MKVLGFNRVELIVGEDEIDAAVRQFNELLGLNLPHPHRIDGQPVLSATDFDGHLELVAPVGGQGHFGARMALHGPGQIGPLVWEVDDIERARERLRSGGYAIRYEYDSSAGTAEEQATGVYQLVLDPGEWFGFHVTLMRRSPAPTAALRPAPVVDVDSESFWRNAAEGRLVIQACSVCDELRHPPTPICPRCHSSESAPRPMSGSGRVASFIIVHHPPNPWFELPIVVATIALDEGPHVTSNVCGIAPESVLVGMRVEAFFAPTDDGFGVPLFREVAP